MAHFAQIDSNNIVTQVIVVADADTADAQGNHMESIGIAFCQRLIGGNWKQTSYNTHEVFTHWVALHFVRITLALDTPMTLSEMLSYLPSPTHLGY